MLTDEPGTDRDQRLYAALADCLEALEHDQTLLPADLARRYPEVAPLREKYLAATVPGQPPQQATTGAA